MRESHVSFLDFKLAWGQSQRAILCHIQCMSKRISWLLLWDRLDWNASRKVIVRMESSVKHTSCKTYLRGLHSNVLHKEVAHDTVAWWHCSQHRALGSINGRKETHFWRQTLLKPFTALWESLYQRVCVYSILVEEPLCTGAIQTHSGIYITQENLRSWLTHLIFIHFVRDIEVLGKADRQKWSAALTEWPLCTTGPLERAEPTAFGFIHSAAL